MVKDQLSDYKAAQQGRIFKLTSEILNTVSIVFALFVVCSIIYLRIRHKKISNRVSLRLQAYVSLNDILFGVFQIMTVNSDPPGNWVCRVSPWGFVFTALLGCFLTVTIAFNLQIIFVHNYLSTRHFEKYYIIIPLVLSLLLSVIPVVFNALGYDEKEVSCWYKNGNTTSAIVWQWTTLHGWIILSVLYCTISVLLITKRLYDANRFLKEMIRPNHIDSNDNNNNNNVNSSDSNAINNGNNNKKINRYSYKRQLMVNRAVKRIVLYPIVPIITFLFNIISNLLFFTSGDRDYNFQMLANIGTSSQGLLNAIAFCFDPAMKNVWNCIFIGLASIFTLNNYNMDEKKEMINDNNNNHHHHGLTNNNIIVNVSQRIYFESHNGDQENSNLGSEFYNDSDDMSSTQFTNSKDEGDDKNNILKLL